MKGRLENQKKNFVYSRLKNKRKILAIGPPHALFSNCSRDRSAIDVVEAWKNINTFAVFALFLLYLSEVVAHVQTFSVRRNRDDSVSFHRSHVYNR